MTVTVTEMSLPERFVLDCIECDCDVGEIIRENRRTIRLRMNPHQREELLSRADHYANGGIDSDCCSPGLIASAKAVYRRLKNADDRA